MFDTLQKLSTPLFPMGQVVATRGFASLCEERGLDMREAGIELLLRHCNGDWGEVCAEDQNANRQALAFGERILSKYAFEGERVYVITERDRSTTTVLLCGEY